MRVHGMCILELSVHGLLINIDAVVLDLNCQAILGMDILGDASKLPFILDLVGGTLSGGGYETIQLHRFQTTTECVWHEPKLHIMRVPLFANFDL